MSFGIIVLRLIPHGHFVVNKVYPGQVQISREISVSFGMVGSAQSKIIELNPGQTANVILGGLGRPVVGQVVVPQDSRESGRWAPFNGIDRTSHQGLSTQPPYPEGFGEMSYDQQSQWLQDWNQRQQQDGERKRERIHYSVVIAEDGTFRVEDIPRRSLCPVCIIR